MVRLVRIAFQCLIVMLLLGVAIGIGTSETGAAEKITLLAIAGLLIYAAFAVRRMGVSPQPHSR